MKTGANFEINSDHQILWYKSLISGDDLLKQDHEIRVSSRPGSYALNPQYGNPFIPTLSSEISEAELLMLLPTNMKECTLQDSRFINCIVDEGSIDVVEDRLIFKYQLIKEDGGTIGMEYV